MPIANSQPKICDESMGTGKSAIGNRKSPNRSGPLATAWWYWLPLIDNRQLAIGNRQCGCRLYIHPSLA